MNALSDDYEQADIYRDWRAQALGLDEKTMEPREGIFALLMETGYEDSAVTVVAATDGSASTYVSNGSETIDPGEYSELRQVVFETLAVAQRFSDQLDRTETYPLPEPGAIRFYLVTDRGVSTATAPDGAPGNSRNDLYPLVLQVHKLILYMCAADERCTAY